MPPAISQKEDRLGGIELHPSLVLSLRLPRSRAFAERQAFYNLTSGITTLPLLSVTAGSTGFFNSTYIASNFRVVIEEEAKGSQESISIRKYIVFREQVC